MQVSPRVRARNQLLFALALLAVALAGYLLTRSAAPQAAPENASSTPSATTTTSTAPAPHEGVMPESKTSFEGEYVCLPHRATGGMQTLECALGLKARSGKYYALASQGSTAESARATTPTGAHVRVTGSVVTPGTEWQTYDIVGVIDVVTFTVL